MKTSAGILFYREANPKQIDKQSLFETSDDLKLTTYNLELLLVHPGGPYFKNRDISSWDIPKGQLEKGEDLMDRAIIEVREETGITEKYIDRNKLIELGTIKQSSGKVVYAWGYELNNLPENFEFKAIEIEITFPPKSDRKIKFAENDKIEWFDIETAKTKIYKAEVEFIERLLKVLSTK